ncbi:protein of unknown function DUF423 [Paenibacillus curdlanolyticus YK9]|uniref:DUF423 domain-containing protein n=1 Tax=Paenibacillus curdlanolyticus YK9 TaxID=717606 RepID=E0IBP1_9BACL|nr:DUF423 domain-containing protein [Paenibacillus curdlanolyticus]EFM10121.1 protein of unknown function DUF423 [Paenibacillus curdlanolyticus YK9]
MVTLTNKYAAFGAVHAMLAVMLGAFGAHGLKDVLDSDMLDVFETGVRYQMYHALALLAVALLAGRAHRPQMIQRGAMLLHIGIFIFSGSLYVLSLSGIKWLGAITPLGGVAFIAGWAMIAWTLWQGRHEKN